MIIQTEPPYVNATLWCRSNIKSLCILRSLMYARYDTDIPYCIVYRS